MSLELTPRPFYDPVKDAQTIEIAHLNMQSLIDNAVPPIRQYMEGLSPDSLIGGGAEKVVYPYDDTEAAAFFRFDQNPETIKREFYERKLMATLLPDCVPDIHLAASEPPMLRTDKVAGVPVVDSRTTIESEFARRITERKFKEVGVHIDTYPKNFVINKDGTAVYVDSIGIKPWDIPSIEAAIDKLPDERKAKAQVYLKRFLAQEAANTQLASLA